MFWSAACRAAVCLCVTVATTPLSVAEDSCVYVNEHGELVPVRNPQTVPRELRNRLVCKDRGIEEIAAPDDLDVGRDARTAEFSTELGPMKVRWSRSIERCFATSPARSVGEAAKAVNRALKSGRFTADVRYTRREWTLAFIDKTAAISQFPLALTVGQHPGFMIPPNRIYLVADYISPNCESREIADDVLTQVLLHEMGHVVEYILLGERQTPLDRERSEGFAVWFEQYSAEFASSLPKGHAQAYYSALARSRDADAGFSPDPGGYAHAGLRFQTIVDRKGIAGLMEVYAVIREQQVPFEVAVERALSWNQSIFQRQIQGYRERNL
jgi:hypothetical protein